MDENKPQSVRDRIRAKALRDKRKRKVIEWEDEKILVVEPSGAAFSSISDKDSGFAQRAKLAVGCAFVCDENGAAIEPLFNAADVDVLIGLGTKDPLLVLVVDTINSLSNSKAMEAEATKSP